MKKLRLSIGEPFTSPAWESNFVVFSGGNVIPEEDAKDYLRKVCKYARGYEVYLVPERFMLMGYQCMCLVSPQGKVLGAQKGLFLNGDAPNGNRAGEIEVLRTDFGGIFLCVDVDIYRPEIPRIAQGMGAQYIICSQTFLEEDPPGSLVFTGPWSAAQHCGLYVIGVSGQLQSVCAPHAITPHQDGFLSAPGSKLPVTAQLVADDLRKCKTPFRLNRKFYAVHHEDLIR